ncbi:MAG: AAA family ATPase [Bacteroidales bacterium]|nr:AAA family ATPase [Bacteroidales bacterium]
MGSQILSHFPHAPTHDQSVVIEKLAHFIADKNPNKVFLLKGFAGTGKTTLVSALVAAVTEMKLKTVLLAPTGRAAKVLSGYCGRPAQTIHKKIYFPNITPEGHLKLTVKENKHSNTLFIVDEASMIPDSEKDNRFGNYTGRDLLSDLINFVYNGKNCFMILVGDSAQLPPVGLEISLALDPQNTTHFSHLSLEMYELTQVVRQAEDSRILRNATRIRQHIQSENFQPPFLYPDVAFDFRYIDGQEMEDALNTACSRYGAEDVIVICRSNKRANLFNRHIRASNYGYEPQITAGDQIMIVKNNYFWLSDAAETDFIANGEMAEVERIKRFEERYGFHFADARIRLIDYPEMESLEVKLLLDTLESESPNLPWEQYRALYNALDEELLHTGAGSRRARMDVIRKNPYFNALQIKFSYALTCHKTQGGQWKCVFVEQGWLTPEHINKEFLRWIYTAITRATEQVYLVNFSDYLIGEDDGI